MSKEFDLAGERFGRLTAIAPVYSNGRKKWLCTCDCGNETTVTTSNLRSGNTRSCGCLWDDVIHEVKTIHGESGGRISGPRTQLYRCWSNMRSRCYNSNVRSYADYGAKGIEVCDDWHDFQCFSEWAKSHGYREGLTIERIDPKGNYCPENCEWITLSENSKRAHAKDCWGKNLETEEYVEFHCIRDFAKERGLSYIAIDHVLHGACKTHKNWTFGYLTT